MLNHPLLRSLVSTKPFSSVQLNIARRTMSTAGKFEYLVIVPDKPGMLAKRLEVRPLHFDGIKPQRDSGFCKMGGALFNETPQGDDPSKWDFMGSTLVCWAESKEEIIEELKKDIYTKSGVWDLDKVQIYPFKAAFREQLN